MSTVLDAVMQGLLMLAFIGALGMGAFGMWHLMPREGRETLQHALKRVSGRRATLHSGPPVYAVHVDGQLLYASGKEDVQDFLGSTMFMMSRQVLRTVDTDQPATLVFTCGEASIVIEVHLA